jgi:hypothetical protein
MIKQAIHIMPSWKGDRTLPLEEKLQGAWAGKGAGILPLLSLPQAPGNDTLQSMCEAVVVESVASSNRAPKNPPRTRFRWMRRARA